MLKQLSAIGDALMVETRTVVSRCWSYRRWSWWNCGFASPMMNRETKTGGCHWKLQDLVAGGAIITILDWVIDA